MINLFYYKTKSNLKQSFIALDLMFLHIGHHPSIFNKYFTYHNYFKLLKVIKLDCLCFI